MILEQFYLGCLSQASYLVADEASGRAVVVDPRRDIDIYLDYAAAHQVRIDTVVLTHVHADFIPGHSELAAATGAVVAMGEAAPVSFPVERWADGHLLALGDPVAGVAIRAIATPGHTPESLTLAVYEHASDRSPTALLTGDTLFLGDVGRPDLLGANGSSAEQMARQLYRSLHSKLLGFPDEVLIYPGHGAGSACGKALSHDTVSTLGEQRRSNYALGAMSEEEFVAAVTEGLAEPPSYFQEEVARNRAGHAPVQLTPLLAGEAPDVDRWQQAGALFLDVRDDQSFAAAHLPGSVNVGLSGRFAEFAAAVHAPQQSVVLVGNADQAHEARLRLARVGIDEVLGYLDPATLDPATLQPASRITVAQARRQLAARPDIQVVDVRGPGEYAAGSLPAAVNVPLPRLRALIGQLEPDRPTLVHCAGGYRSSAAASLLRAGGFRDVTDLIGGYAAWEASTPELADAAG